MNDSNYIDISSVLRRAFVYRIISVERLFELFDLKLNVLVKPKSWEDPFENFILQSHVKLSTGDLAKLEARNQIYGQCWMYYNGEGVFLAESVCRRWTGKLF